MLVVQAFTLIFAALAALKTKPIIFLSTTILSIVTALLMWLTSRAFNYPFAYVVPQYTFQHGFWLTLTAAALSLTTFLYRHMSLRHSKASRLPGGTYKTTEYA